VAQFAEKGVEVVGVSIDSQFTHNAWRNTAPKDRQANVKKTKDKQTNNDKQNTAQETTRITQYTY
jgi:alkyl hydroperoxide reductase subunit AhpC